MGYTATKRIEIAGLHQLDLPYKSPCTRQHGHNWIIEVEVCAEELNEEGMVIDFTHISEIVNRLDHRNLNNFIKQPTAENIAKWIRDEIEKELDIHRDEDSNRSWVSKVTVQESEGNVACYIP